MQSAIILENLHETQDQVVTELLLQGRGELRPEGGGWLGHGGVHSFTKDRKSRRASKVNFVAGRGRRGERFVAASGRRSCWESCPATTTRRVP